ncbi:hypothetical protein J3458_015174 [Metarhizium acridum]|uniref:uncharacterized protein n=1 Tax=Metarhizium acridum TaxID=92637 RepID=UPI001C6A8F78|nr:hypothetical protein J3458_015174 [Metarhizium acridum]
MTCLGKLDQTTITPPHHVSRGRLCAYPVEQSMPKSQLPRSTPGSGRQTDDTGGLEIPRTDESQASPRTVFPQLKNSGGAQAIHWLVISNYNPRTEYNGEIGN